MYFPYFRGKQYELITIRESASLIANAGFVPIIEPVKESLSGLEKALDALCEANGKGIVIINPIYGDHSANGQNITTLLSDQIDKYSNVSVGILLTDKTILAHVVELYHAHAKNHSISLIHAGFKDTKSLTETIPAPASHIFFETYCGKLYRKHFQANTRALLRDGFKKRRNADHPDIEAFSDLHVTYSEENVEGFGDFLTVGDDYQESGGPAYAIAIHLTFIDDEQDDEMYIYHFKSERKNSPKDPAGKFMEALDSMIQELNKPNCKVLETEAVAEFRALHQRRHFPGLGYVKKLSMKHHIETLAHYFNHS